MGSECLMFDVELPVTLHLCFIACRPVVSDVATNICVGIDVFMKVMREGLIKLLVVVSALTSSRAWWVAVVA